MWKMGGDTSGFNKAIDQTSTRTSKFKSLLKTVGPAFSIGLLVGGLQRLTAEMDATAKTARKLGVGAELLQEMRFAAERTGVAQTALDMGLQRFTRRLAEAAKGSGELKGVLEQYNIAATNADGTTRSNVDVLGDLAEVIKNTKDPAEQLRIAFKAFDSEGAAMVNTLRNGRDGLEELRKQARDTGQVVGGDTLKQFEEFSDELGILKGAAKTTAAEVGGPLVSAVSVMGKAWLTAVHTINKPALALVNHFREDVPTAVETATAAIEEITVSVKKLQKVTEELRSIDQIYADFDFKRLSTSEQLVQRQQEYNALNEQALTTTMSSAEGLKLHREIAEKYVALQETRQKLEEESVKAGATLSKEARAQLEAAAAKYGISVKELEVNGQAVSDAALRAAINEKIVGTSEYAVLQARSIAAAEKEASAAAWDRYNAKMATIKIGTGGDNIEGLSSDKLQYLLSQQKKELGAAERADTSSAFSVGTSFIQAGIQSFINRIEGELDTRRQFENLSGSAALGLKFNPFEQDRLSSVTTPQSDAARQTALLESIDEKLDIQNRRTPLY